MPHDKHGRKIEEGDVIVARHWVHGREAACLVMGVCEGAETCNLTVQSVQAPLAAPQTITAKETEILLKRDGSKPADEKPQS